MRVVLTRAGARAAVRLGLALALALTPGASAGQLPAGAEHEAIAYSTTTPTDPVARLAREIDAGRATLAFDGPTGYLVSLLRQLGIPVSSQALIFSRTSLQVDRITPWSPRAVYFNDEVYVGYAQNSPTLEIVAVDPVLGAVFYTLDQTRDAPPRFQRQTQTCLQCHDSSSSTGGVPGIILRSVVTDRYGYPVWAVGGGATTDRSPFEERWGGWYVTGTHGAQTHMGNFMVPMLAHEIGNVPQLVAGIRLGPNGNVVQLKGRFDVGRYLTPHSDIVALLVLAHQGYVHNLVTLAGYEGRKALYDERLLAASRGASPEGHSEATLMRVQGAVERLVRALFFSREAPITARVRGTSGFAEEFARQGPRDARGRSLRDLDLERRMFRYPLSYLVYSDGFNALPAVVKDAVYRRMREVLLSDDSGRDFAHLTPADRRAILEILTQTKPDFAATLAPAGKPADR